jgi:hypothetical protein
MTLQPPPPFVTPGQSIPLVAHNPKKMLFTLMSDARYGIAVTADDGATMLKPTDLNFRMEPYLQEKSGPYPLVVFGSETPISYAPYTGDMAAEVHKRVEVRVYATPQTIPIQLDGETVRGKLVEAVRSFVRAHHSDPDQTHAYDRILVEDPGRNMDDPSRAPFLFKTTMQIGVWWYE